MIPLLGISMQHMCFIDSWFRIHVERINMFVMDIVTELKDGKDHIPFKMTFFKSVRNVYSLSRVPLIIEKKSTMYRWNDGRKYQNKLKN